jgi:ABC-type multidrug transport system fused ATPase/permease subunit
VLLAALLPYLMGLAINIIGGPQGGRTRPARHPGRHGRGVGRHVAHGLVAQPHHGGAGGGALYRLRKNLFDHIQTLSLNFFDRQPIGELMSSVTNDMDSDRQLLLAQPLSQAITATTTIVIVTVGFMFFLSVPLTITRR